MSKTIKVGLWIIILILVVFGITALNKGKKDVENEPIKIGVIAPLTGIVADYGEEIKKGILSVQSDEVEFIFEDDKCEPKEAVSAVKKLIEFNKVNFIIGPACGSPQEAIVPILKDKDVLAIVPSAASTAIFKDSNGKIYNIQYSLEEESKFIAEQISSLGYKKVALVSYQNAFSKTHADSFRKNYKGTIVSDNVLLDDSSDIATEIAKIKSTKPEAIYSPDISFFFANGLAKSEQFGLKVPIFATYVTELPAVRTLVPNVIYSFPAEISENEGAVFGLSKQAAEIMISATKQCASDYNCVKRYLDESKLFDQTGVKIRDILLKQIKNGKPEIFGN